MSSTFLTRLELREESASVKRLLTLFCNHLSLGQWELARLSFQGLVETQLQLRDILLGLIANPHEFSGLSSTLPSSCHLSWLCFLEWLKHCPDEKALQAAIQPRLELCLVLEAISVQRSDQVLQEIFDYHEHLLSVAGFAPSLQDVRTSHQFTCKELSVDLLDFIKGCLQSHLDYGHALVKHLSFQSVCADKLLFGDSVAVTCGSHNEGTWFKNDQLLQSAYMQCISEHLAKVNRKSPKDSSSLLQQVYGLLTRMDATAEMLDLPLDALFTDLLQLTYGKSDVAEEQPLLDRHSLYTCFLSSSQPWLLQRFCEVEERLMSTGTIPNSRAFSSPVLQQASPRIDAIGNDSESGLRTSRQLFSEPEKLIEHTERWQNSFFTAMHNGKHFLENILEHGLQLIRQGDFSELASLLSPPEFAPLRPLLILLGWEQCSDCDAVSSLLASLWTNQDVNRVPAHLQQACQRLTYQVHLVQWCLEKARSRGVTSRSSGPRSLEMFAGFQAHSVLYVLQASTSLADLDPTEVIDMLKRRPLVAVSASSPTKSFGYLVPASPSRPVRDALVQKGAHNGSARVLARSASLSALSTAISTEQERDLAVYYSFCAVKEFMNVLVVGLDARLPTDHAVLLSNLHPDLQQLNQLKGEEMEKSMLSRLSQAKEYLSLVYPLNYRLEVLEDLFSLLFVRRADLSVAVAADSSSSATDEPGQHQKDVKASGSSTAARDSCGGQQTTLGSTQVFVVVETVAKQLLSVLKDCLISLTSAKFAQLSTSSAGVASEDARRHGGDLVRTSVPMDSLQARINRLDQYINEAKWRLALVVGDSSATSSQLLSSSSDESSMSEMELSSSDSEEDVSEPRKRQKKRRRWRHSRTSPSSGSRETTPKDEFRKQASRVLQRQTAPSDGTEVSVKSSRLSKGRTRSRPSGLALKRSVQRFVGLIPQMLATPQSLLYTCLRHHRFERAREVIKMFSLEEQDCAQEVIFAERLRTVKERLMLLGRPSSAPSKAVPHSIAAAINSTPQSGSPLSASHQRQASTAVNELLSSSAMPVTVGQVKQGRSSMISESRQRWQHLLNSMLPSLVVMDIVATCNLDNSISYHLLKLAVERAEQSEVAELHRGKVSRVSPNDSRRRPMQARDCMLVSPYHLLHRWQRLLTNDSPTGLQSLLSTGAPEAQGVSSTQAHGVSSIRKIIKKITSQSLHQQLSGGMEPLAAPTLLSQLQVLEKRQQAWCELEDAMESTKSIPLHELEPVLSEDGTRSPLRQAIQDILCAHEGGQEQPAIHGVVRYLAQFFNHVENLASLLVAAGKSENDEAFDLTLRPKNPLAVLKEAPMVTLGRLMFDDHLPPSKVEGIARDLGLDLVQIIMQCCCPSLPARPLARAHHCALDSECDSAEFPQGRSIRTLNAMPAQRGEEKSSQPVQLSVNLLNKMLSLMKAKSRLSPKRLLDGDAAASLRSSDEFQEIVVQTSDLALVDLKELKDDCSRLCFFTNVLNLLLAHAAITAGDLWPQNAAAHLLFLKTQCYFIGQLGEISAFDIWHTILRNGADECHPYGQNSSALFPSLPASDPWKMFALQQREFRLLFVISDSCLSSPPPKVLDTDMDLNSVLDVACSTFLAETVDVSSQKEVLLPAQLNWFRYDFTALDGPSGDLELVRFVQNHLVGEKAVVLQRLLMQVDGLALTSRRSPAVQSFVGFAHFDWQLSYRLITGVDVHMVSQGLESGDSNELTLPNSSAMAICKAPYDLTASAMDYLAGKLPLASALASLVCPRQVQETLDSSELDHSDHGLELTASIRATVTNFTERLSSSLASSVPPSGSPQLSIDFGVVQSVQHFLQEVLEWTGDFPALQRFVASRLVAVPRGSEHGDVETCEYVSVLQALILLPSCNGSVRTAACHLFEWFLQRGKWREAVCLLDSELFLQYGGTATCAPDVWLSAASALPPAESDQPLDNICSVEWKHFQDAFPKDMLTYRQSSAHLAGRVLEPGSRARLVLGQMQKWPIEVALGLLQGCLSKLTMAHPMRLTVEQASERLVLYQKVQACILQQASGEELDQLLSSPARPPDETEVLSGEIPLCAWRSWTTVQLCSERLPDLVVKPLLHAGEFELLQRWRALHNVPTDLSQLIQEKHVFSCLQGDSPDLIKAFRILEQIEDKSVTVAVCKSLRQSLDDLSCVIFVVQFELRYLAPSLSIDEHQELEQLCIGAQVLMCLPRLQRSHYEHLMSKPCLLVEQLLMNMKVELAEKVIRSLRSYEQSSSHDEESDSDDDEIAAAFSPRDEHGERRRLQHLTLLQRLLCHVDDLVSKYSEKALEFPASYIPPMLNSNSRSSSVSSLVAVSEKSPATESPGRSRTPREPFRSTSRRAITSTPLSTPQISFTETIRRQLKQREKDKAKAFQFPQFAPPKSEWVKDETVSMCMVCQEERFSMFNRRHHCRRCGRVVCQTCSTRKAVVEGCGDKYVRICEQCYEMFYDPRESEVTQTQDSSDSKGGSPYFDESLMADLPKLPPVMSGMSLLLHSDEQLWQLNASNEVENSQVRDEFYYDQAPSIGLCLSIVTLHSREEDRGRLLLQFASSISNHLRPIAPGHLNDEVDHYLVISMMQKLVLNAKLHFMQVGDNGSVQLCDTYLSRVELLRLLVSHRCYLIPSMHDLLTADGARRLRDRLLEDDRPDLAVEMSTKCNLETQSVWAAWGKACLRSGQYVAARDKFRHCFVKATPNMQSTITSSQQALLGSVIDFIESSPVIHMCSAAELLDNVPGTNLQPVGLSTHLDSVRFAECLHYLHQYGTPLQLLRFLQRHNMLNKACAHVLDKGVSVDAFLDGLVEPCMRHGSLRELLEQMHSQDPAMQQWLSYVMAMCRYLTRRNLHHSLYNLQLFVKDYVRAAMTCIKFFIGEFGNPCRTYGQMYQRLPWLRNAKEHFHLAIDQRQWVESTSSLKSVSSFWVPSGKPVGPRPMSPMRSVQTSIYDAPAEMDAGPESPSADKGPAEARKSMQPGDITRHMNTITLQIEVTQLLHKFTAGGEASSSSLPQPLPTLFNRNSVREEVACQVILLDQSIEEGFKLAYKVIQDFRLNDMRVLTKVARTLTTQMDWRRFDVVLRCMQSLGMASERSADQVVLAAIGAIASDPRSSKQLDRLIGMLHSVDNKVDAMLRSNKLKNAYLIAVKAQRVDLIQRIAAAARDQNQSAILRVCEHFLSKPVG